MQKASSKAVADYGFHCIITDLPDAQLAEMPQLVREGITTFKLFMAYPGVFMLDDASIFKAMRTSAKAGAMVCMHAENGGAIDVIVKQALAPWDAGRAYLNFAELSTTGQRLFGAETYARLRRVKAAYDPQDVIRSNHPVPPARPPRERRRRSATRRVRA